MAESDFHLAVARERPRRDSGYGLDCAGLSGFRFGGFRFRSLGLGLGLGLDLGGDCKGLRGIRVGREFSDLSRTEGDFGRGR